MDGNGIRARVSPDSPIPDKLYFKIGEAAELVGVEPHVLRYWEKELPGVRPVKSTTNQRRYRKREIEIFRQVRKLLHEDRYTLAGVRKQLSRPEDVRVAAASNAAAHGASNGAALGASNGAANGKKSAAARPVKPADGPQTNGTTREVANHAAPTREPRPIDPVELESTVNGIRQRVEGLLRLCTDVSAEANRASGNTTINRV